MANSSKNMMSKFSDEHGTTFPLTDEEFNILKAFEDQEKEIRENIIAFTRQICKRLGLHGGYFVKLDIPNKQIFVKPEQNTALPEKMRMTQL